MSSSQDEKERRVVGFVGLGLDNKDGHQRLTQSEHFLLLGGSEETHEHMQNTAIKFSESLRKKGKELSALPLEEVIEIFHEAKE